MNVSPRKQRSALLPMVMSFAALAWVLGHAAIFGSVREADEGTAAHVFQLLMAASPPPLGAPSGALACPLTPVQEQKAVEAFDKMMPIVTHPRCLNCHGGVDAFAEQEQGGHLGGRMVRDTVDSRVQCQLCHDGLLGWEGSVFDFVGKSAKELCIHFKKTKPTGDLFVGHVANDNGRIQFTATAFKGDRALNEGAKTISEVETGLPFTIQPPPGTHQEFITLARVWADAMGIGWSVMPDCGCKVTGKTWVGTVTSVFELNSDLGRLKETTSATARFEIDSSFMTPGETSTYWKSTSGVIKWTTNLTGGQCSGSASGTVPIGLGEDLNPMAVLHGEDAGNGATRFSVAIGPWPDPYRPAFAWRCTSPVRRLPHTLIVGTLWWSHEPAGVLSADGQTLKGRYRTAVSSGTMEWVWDFRLVP